MVEEYERRFSEDRTLPEDTRRHIPVGSSRMEKEERGDAFGINGVYRYSAKRCSKIVALLQFEWISNSSSSLPLSLSLSGMN